MDNPSYVVDDLVKQRMRETGKSYPVTLREVLSENKPAPVKYDRTAIPKWRWYADKRGRVGDALVDDGVALQRLAQVALSQPKNRDGSINTELAVNAINQREGVAQSAASCFLDAHTRQRMSKENATAADVGTNNPYAAQYKRNFEQVLAEFPGAAKAYNTGMLDAQGFAEIAWPLVKKSFSESTTTIKKYEYKK